MKYLEAHFTLQPVSEINSDILKALAGEAGFDSFTDTSDGFLAYIRETEYNAGKVNEQLHSFPLEFTYTYTIQKAEDKNWNAAWEKEGFEPVYIGPHKEIVVHDTQHPVDGTANYDIRINPQMAFGTGTHETTGMLLGMLLEEDLKGKKILDMGCGTGVLGIFCHMKGAGSVTAIDIDEWSVRNAASNARLNHIGQGFTALRGSAESLSDKDGYDLVIANINRNILLHDMDCYARSMKPHNTKLYLSGFYTEDIPSLVEKAANYGFSQLEANQCHNWASLKLFRK